MINLEVQGHNFLPNVVSRPHPPPMVLQVQGLQAKLLCKKETNMETHWRGEKFFLASEVGMI